METHETSTRKLTWAKGFKYGLYAIGGISLAVLFAIVFGYFVMHLWNWLMPELFGLSTITYWQAFGIIILARLIFGQIGHKHSHNDKNSNHPWKSKYHSMRSCKDSQWKDWKYYDKYWEEGGKQAFEDYVQKRKNEESEQV